jgi:hypothetical protein
MRFINSRILPHINLPAELKGMALELAQRDADLSGQASTSVLSPSSFHRPSVRVAATQAVDPPPLRQAAAGAA